MLAQKKNHENMHGSQLLKYTLIWKIKCCNCIIYNIKQIMTKFILLHEIVKKKYTNALNSHPWLWSITLNCLKIMYYMY